jgi:hypothetical protein
VGRPLDFFFGSCGGCSVICFRLPLGLKLNSTKAGSKRLAMVTNSGREGPRRLWCLCICPSGPQAIDFYFQGSFEEVGEA